MNAEQLKASILACCEEEGDCLIWQGGSAKVPHLTVSGKKVNVRALMLQAHAIQRIDGTLLGCSCRNRKCVAVEHIRQRTRLQHAQYFGKLGAYSGPVKVAKMAATKRARSKLDDEKVAAIRASTKSAKALSAEYGVAASYITSIRARKLWKDYASPFAGLFSGLVAGGAR